MRHVEQRRLEFVHKVYIMNKSSNAIIRIDDIIVHHFWVQVTNCIIFPKAGKLTKRLCSLCHPQRRFSRPVLPGDLVEPRFTSSSDSLSSANVLIIVENRDERSKNTFLQIITDITFQL